MILYADTSLLISYYINDSNSVSAQATFSDRPLPFTGLHRLEMRNALLLGLSAHPHLRQASTAWSMWGAIWRSGRWSLNPSLDTGLSHRSTMGRAPQSPHRLPQPRCVTCPLLAKSLTQGVFSLSTNGRNRWRSYLDWLSNHKETWNGREVNFY